MRTKFIKLILLLVAIVLIVSACKKKDDGLQTFTHRIISEKWYQNNQLDGEQTYTYSGNKLSKVTQDDSYWTYESNFTYSTNKITMISFETNGTEVYRDTAVFTLSNNRISEIVVGTNDEKLTFSYNSDGKISKMKYYYYYNGSWTLDDESTFSYNSGNLTQIYEIYYGETSNDEDKYLFSYNGEELKDQIHLYKESGGTWTECHKYGYTYSAGRISKINYYSKNGGTTWVEDTGYDTYSYDTHGNLIEISEVGDGYDYRTDYTYEEGSGNFRQIFEFIEYDYMTPMPNKKSQGIEKNIHNTHNFNQIPLFLKKHF